MTRSTVAGLHGLFSEIKICSQLFMCLVRIRLYAILFAFSLLLFTHGLQFISLDYTYRTMWLIFGRSLWNLKMKFQTPTSDNMLFRRLEVTILVAFSWEALLKDFYMDSGFHHRLELFHGSFLKHVELYGITSSRTIPSLTPELSQVTHQANVCYWQTVESGIIRQCQESSSHMDFHVTRCWLLS